MLADLKAKIEARPQLALVAPRRLPPPDEREDAVRRLIRERGCVTASDVQLELGVSHSTAVRAIRGVARAKDGIIVEEVAGPTFRIVLWHPDRVILDHVAQH